MRMSCHPKQSDRPSSYTLALAGSGSSGLATLCSMRVREFRSSYTVLYESQGVQA